MVTMKGVPQALNALPLPLLLAWQACCVLQL